MRSSRGNVLFLILLAVVLFAALAYAVTSSMRGGGRDSSAELAKTNAATIINYFALMENTVQRMMLMGIKVEHLDFSDAASANVLVGAANSACTNDDCRVFKQMNVMAAPRSASIKGVPFNGSVWTTDWEGRPHVINISVKNTGTDAADILLHFKGLSKDVCDQINIMSGVYKEGDAPISDLEILGAQNVGYANSNGANSLTGLTVNQFGNIDARIAGRQTFCILRHSTSGYYAYHVLVAR